MSLTDAITAGRVVVIIDDGSAGITTGRHFVRLDRLERNFDVALAQSRDRLEELRASLAEFKLETLKLVSDRPPLPPWRGPAMQVMQIRMHIMQTPRCSHAAARRDRRRRRRTKWLAELRA